MDRFTHDKHGFTLIEIIVAVFVMTLMSASVIAFLRSTSRNTGMIQESLTSQSQSRKVLQKFTSEIRSALPAFDGANVIASASSTAIIFYANIDSDQYTEKLRYELVGTKLVRGVTKFNTVSGHYDLAETVNTVVSSVDTTATTSLFAYYDKLYDGQSTYPSLSAPVDIAKIRLVRFNLPINSYGRYGKNQTAYSVQVAFRNLKDNY